MSLNPGSSRRRQPWLALIAAIALSLCMLVAPSNAVASYKAPSELFSANSTKDSVELVWRTITGAPAYRLRAVGGGQTLYQNTSSDGTAIFKGLQPSTSYTFNVAVFQPSNGKLLSSWSKAKATKATTAASMMDAPTALKVTKQAPSALTLSWVNPAGFNPAQHAVRIDYAEDQRMRGAGSQFFTDTAGTLGGLSSNTNYYLRVSIVDLTTRAAIGDRSAAVLGKTLSPVGWIHGTVTGAPKAALVNYVVAAYSQSTGDVNKQVSLTPTSDPGTYEYRLQVRPGSYFVQVVNVGSTNYTSLWALAGDLGAPVLRSATPVAVTMSNVTEAPPVTVGEGATIKGTVTCPGQGTKDSCSVDVTALIGKDVIAQDRSESNGTYALKGLPAGDYTVRMNHAEDRFVNENLAASAGAAGSTTQVDNTLARRQFLTKYKVRISGTKKVGKVLKFASKSYLASVLPTERADNNDYQWYRNGSPIAGAGGSSYRLTSADRGKKIRLGVVFGRFGFVSSSRAFSASYTVR